MRGPTPLVNFAHEHDQNENKFAKLITLMMRRGSDMRRASRASRVGHLGRKSQNKTGARFFAEIYGSDSRGRTTELCPGGKFPMPTQGT